MSTSRRAMGRMRNSRPAGVSTGRYKFMITGMKHRHLDHSNFTLAAVDDVIARGSMTDWLELRDAADADPIVLRRIEKVCAAYTRDPYAQRYHFWAHVAADKA